MAATTGPPDVSGQAVIPARPAPPPMEKDGVLIGLVVAAIGLIVALIGLGAMGFFHLDSRIDAQDTELRTAMAEGFRDINQRIDGLYDLIAQGRK